MTIPLPCIEYTKYKIPNWLEMGKNGTVLCCFFLFVSSTDEFATLNWPTNNILMIGSHRIYLSCQAIYIASNKYEWWIFSFCWQSIHVRGKKCVRVDTKNWMLLIINFWYASTHVCNINEIIAKNVERECWGLCGRKRRWEEQQNTRSWVSEWVSESGVWFHGNK